MKQLASIAWNILIPIFDKKYKMVSILSSPVRDLGADHRANRQ